MSIKTTLVVDDSKSARIMLSRMLQKQGLETHMVESGEEAVTFMEQNSAIDAIFLDHMMPGLDGIATCKIISAKHGSPIFMYTSKEGPEYEAEALEAGAAGILGKPAKPERLQTIIQELNDGVYQKAATAEDAQPEIEEVQKQEPAPTITTAEEPVIPAEEEEMPREMIEQVAQEVFNQQFRELIEPTTDNLASMKSDISENQSEIRKLASRQANSSNLVSQPVLDASIKQTTAQFQSQITTEVQALRELIEKSTELSPSDLEQIKDIAIKSGAIAGSEEGSKAATSAAEAVAAKVSAAQAQIQVQQDIQPLLDKVKTASTMSTIALVVGIAAVAVSFLL